MLADPGGAAAEVRTPLVVDLDGTLLCADTLDEAFAAAFFRHPLLTLWVTVQALLGGRARLKQALCEIATLDVETLPLRASLVAYLHDQKRCGRELHLATAADQSVAHAVAARVGLFKRIYASDGARNLKGRTKAETLVAEFPQGFAYAGDCHADLEVWRVAASAVVCAPLRLARKVTGVTELEHHIDDGRGVVRAWFKAARPHQWTKNLLVMVPAALGWVVLTPEGLARMAAALILMCLISSLTYIVNDVADVQSDRRHARKHSRPFAAGALKLRDGLIAGGLGVPLLLIAAWLIVGPGAALALLAYAVITLSYSMGLKRIAVLDCMIIGVLFTLRIATGIAAGDLIWSPWLLTFSIALFFSLAMAKRLTELVAGAPQASGAVRGRGYRYEDRGFVMTFGAAASTLSILIVVLYLMEEVFPQGAYRHPAALWAAPLLIFLWVGRIWLVANRGEMHDDPVVFALRDPASHMLAVAMAGAFLAAVL
jgi:4-hydroxybenzoate polyprenyltransferase